MGLKWVLCFYFVCFVCYLLEGLYLVILRVELPLRFVQKGKFLTCKLIMEIGSGFFDMSK